MLLKWVLIKQTKKKKKKRGGIKKLFFVGPAKFASANKALFNSFRVSVYKQTLGSRTWFSCWSLLNIIIYYMCWCFDWFKIVFKNRYTSLESCYLFPRLFAEREKVYLLHSFYRTKYFIFNMILFEAKKGFSFIFVLFLHAIVYTAQSECSITA